MANFSLSTTFFTVFNMFVILLIYSAFAKALSMTVSSFNGRRVLQRSPDLICRPFGAANLTMRKQKASDKRTRRLQRGERGPIGSVLQLEKKHAGVSLLSPTDTASWKHKSVSSTPVVSTAKGRGRSRKRSRLYNTFATYHSTFLGLLTSEFRAEESLVRDRIESVSDNPLALEDTGQALFDMFPERRGNIFSDEVYRLSRADDATVSLPSHQTKETLGALPSNHKFSQNDVIMLTLQPAGSGDFFRSDTIPTRREATSLEARVLSTGPSYIDVVIGGGLFESIFGPSPNNLGSSGKGDPNMRLRIDRYFSNVPYNRMVAALSQMTKISDDKPSIRQKNTGKEIEARRQVYFDEAIRKAILFSYSFDDDSNTFYQDEEAYDLPLLARRLAKPPMAESAKLCNQVLAYMQSNPHGSFPKFNRSQISAIAASLTRRLTMIQGPPGTGKTTVAASIIFGFVHKCRHLPGQNKVLATAFSNVGTDNIAEQALRLGLKVLRLGKASAVSQSLWDYTLDAAIDRDPTAQKALKDAAQATENLRSLGSNQNGRKGSGSRSKVDVSIARNRREVATNAVKASIQACNIAATKAMREADVIVCTSIGAADSRLLRACGILLDDGDEEGDLRMKVSEKNAHGRKRQQLTREKQQLAPDGLSPISFPFVIIDEACQSIEPATLIPVVSTDSCRSLVMLGDPCQLPPTVIGDHSGKGSSLLSIPLMSRLASSLPQPVIMIDQGNKVGKETSFLDMKQTKQAVSFIRKGKSESNKINTSYRKMFSGAMLLSVQYRMHPSIAALPSAIFYGGLLSTPSFLSHDRNFPAVLDEILPSKGSDVNVRLVNVGGCNNEYRGEKAPLQAPSFSASDDADTPGRNMSFSNKAEAIQIISLLKDMMSGNSTETSFTGSIGVITPYASQVALLKSMMASDFEFRSLAKGFRYPIEVNSVDGYQGRESDLIIFSAVRSNKRGNIGFLSDWRRMNVALTRAKYGLIVFGDMKTLQAGDVHWEAFCNWCDSIGCALDVNH